MYEGLGYAKRKLVDEIIRQNWNLIKIDEKKQYTYNDLLFIIQELNSQEGKPYLEGNNSINYGYEVFRRFVQLLLYRNLANYDSMLLLTADKGTGKSSAAIMIAREWCKLLGIRFDPNRHMAYNNADLMAKIDKLNAFEPIICDEAVRFASSEDWAKCISGNTIIKIKINNKIKNITIKQLLKLNNYKVQTYNINKNKIQYQKPKKTIYSGQKILYEVILENGQKIKTTKEHLFLTNNGYKKLQNLKKGDEVIGI